MPTQRESLQERQKAASTYTPGVTYILEYKKGDKGAVKREGFTNRERRDEKARKLESQGYTIVGRHTHTR